MSKYDLQIQAMLNQKAAIEFGAVEPSFMIRTGHVQGDRAAQKAAMIDESQSRCAASEKRSLINEAEVIAEFYKDARRKD